MNPFKSSLCLSEINMVACDTQEQAELSKMAGRPPAGLVLCKYGSRSVVGFIALGARNVVLKYYYPRTWLKRVTYGVSGSRAHRSWTTGLALTKMGISTAEPLALMEWKSGGGLVLDRSFLAVRHVPGVDLYSFVTQYSGDAMRLEAVAANLKTAFALMARNRVAHGDLKATNIIVGDHCSITFIDLDAAVVGASSSSWPALRARDVELFFGNWKQHPVATAAFRDVFNAP
jgi:tRNA A-37 threonylcarbamoyl transferase component Bud32